MAMQNSYADLVFDCPPEAAAPILTEALVASGATGLAPLGPGAIQFQYKFKNLMKAGMLGLVMSGQMTLAGDGRSGSTARLDMKLNWAGNTAYVALLIGGTLVFVFALLSWLNENGSDLTGAGVALVVVVALAIPGLSAFNLTRRAGPAKLQLLTALRQRLAAMPARAAAPAPAGPAAPAVQPAPATPSAPPPPPLAEPVSGSSVVDKIKQLGQLRDAGLITDAEFTEQKTELLKRL